MSHLHGLEKFKAATLNLVGPGDIHARVQAALGQHLIHLSPNEDVPEIIQGQLQALIGQYHDNSVEKIKSLSELDAEHLAQRIVHMLCQWLESMH